MGSSFIMSSKNSFFSDYTSEPVCLDIKPRSTLRMTCNEFRLFAKMMVRKFKLVMFLSSISVLLYAAVSRKLSSIHERNSIQSLPERAHHVFHDSSMNSVNDSLDLQRFEWSRDKLRIAAPFPGDSTLEINGLSGMINRVKPQILSEKLLKAELSSYKFFEGSRRVETCSCNSIFANNKSEIFKARALPREQKYSDEDLVERTRNCSTFIEERNYITDPLTEVEKEFPIAFSILMFKDAEQSERLLRAIYRPQNLYCIHVDKKALQSTYNAMLSIASCFDNVFMASVRINVVWGTASVIEPDLQCMSELYQRSRTWKYFINLTGQEFPLKTNFELVQILKAYNGANDIEGTRKRINIDRWKHAGLPPHNITPIKGSVHIVASRGFVKFALHDQKAKDFWDWSKNTSHSSEVFFNSLNHNPDLGVPGSYRGVPETFSVDATNEKPFVARFKNWGDKIFGWPCHGKWVRSICIIGVGDLPLLGTRKELFVNKLHYDFEPMSYACLEELHFNHTRDIYLGRRSFDATWYGDLGFVKNKV